MTAQEKLDTLLRAKQPTLDQVTRAKYRSQCYNLPMCEALQQVWEMDVAEARDSLCE